MKLRFGAVIVCMFMVLAVMVGGCGQTADPETPTEDPETPTEDPETPTEDPEPSKYGGALRLATHNETPSLDPNWTTAGQASLIGAQVWERLFDVDAEGQIHPTLATGFDVSADELTYTIYLRDDVTFHDGTSFTAEDAVASFERFLVVNSRGRILARSVGSVDEVDEHTMQIVLSEPNALVLVYLSDYYRAAIMMPKWVMDASRDDSGEFGAEITDPSLFIGTGPFEFVEWLPDRHVKLQRYEDYVAVDLPPSLGSGAKIAYVDELYFMPIPDDAVRVAGVRTGDFHWADRVRGDDYIPLTEATDINVGAGAMRNWGTLVFNLHHTITADVRVRRAFQLSLDHDPIAMSWMGHPDLYRVDSSTMFQGNPYWTTAGADDHNAYDPERAKALLDDAGYDGSPLVWFSRELEFERDLAAKQQTEDAGFVWDYSVRDWPSIAAITRQWPQTDQWSVYGTGLTQPNEPTMSAWLGDRSIAYWENERKDELVDQMLRISDVDQRFELWEEVQELFYEEIPVMRLSDSAAVRAWAIGVHGIESGGPGLAEPPFFWGIWMDDSIR